MMSFFFFFLAHDCQELMEQFSKKQTNSKITFCDSTALGLMVITDDGLDLAGLISQGFLPKS